MEHVYQLKTPFEIEGQVINEVQLLAPSMRGKGFSKLCSKLAGFIIGADTRAQLETVKAVQGIDFGDAIATKKKEHKEESKEMLAAQFLARCCMSDPDFSEGLVQRFTEVATKSPNVITFLGIGIANQALELMDWRDLEMVAALYATVFIQP